MLDVELDRPTVCRREDAADDLRRAGFVAGYLTLLPGSRRRRCAADRVHVGLARSGTVGARDARIPNATREGRLTTFALYGVTRRFRRW